MAPNPANMHRKARGSCTHTTMDRVYSFRRTCDLCGSKSSMGFIYACSQDVADESAKAPISDHSPDYVPEHKSPRAELEWLGMSPSIIQQAEAGEYTAAQLDKLKAMRLNCIKTAAAQSAAQAAARSQRISNSTCSFQVCPRCRPTLVQRTYVSIESILADDAKALTPEEARSLPVHNVEVVKNIGLRAHASSSRSSGLKRKKEQADDSTSFQISKIQKYKNDYIRLRGLNNADNDSLSSSFNRHMNKLTGSMKDAISTESDDESDDPDRGQDANESEDAKKLRKAKAKNALLTMRELEVRVERNRKREREREASHGSDRARNDSHQVDPEENTEVGAGLALTEEAAELHTPDVTLIEKDPKDDEEVMMTAGDTTHISDILAQV
ncbi:hypothetical protein K402DRAFT_451501 [Aulographum hederae CBS 113979]|uniref:Uncharacterized protein n=1 Tax=Aulographum hederae CBS 113979 TaxID=1176131 RepID=A0A6G1H9G8_9PEZI|nr:hypothetical protein K402DRAFT_451501 [Aulographum hederae CBS 113979]